MTTEDDFQKALDADPNDWHTRLVFADWLQDRDDPRADGYRAMGRQRKRPFVCGFDNKPSPNWAGAAWIGHGLDADEAIYDLPGDWFVLVRGLGRNAAYRPSYGVAKPKKVRRRVVEDAIALAFGRLPAERLAELLAPPARTRKRSGTPRKPKKPKG